MNELHKIINESVAREARLASARWNKLLPADDIEQDLWIFILERPSVQEYLRTANAQQTKAALSRQADTICSKEQVDYEHFTGNFTYTPKDVRGILERITSEKRVLDDERIDLEMGLEQLDKEFPNHRKVIQEAFVLGDPKYLKGSLSVAKTRALDKLADCMNRKRSQRAYDRNEGPGTRPAHTNNREEV